MGFEEQRDEAVALHERAHELMSEGDLAGAREHLERSRKLLAEALGTEDHPDLAVSLHALGGVYEAEGKPEEAIAAFREALAMEERFFGGLDQPPSAETEVELGRILIEGGKLEEARKHLAHAVAVFESEQPDHPALEAARFMAVTGLTVRVAKLAQAAIQARLTGGKPEEVLLQILVALERLPAPHPAAGVFLRAVATGGTPAIPEGLADPVAEFLYRVLAAAEGGVAINPPMIAQAALDARRNGEPIDAEAADQLETMANAGPPHDRVAATLRDVAAGREVAPPDDDMSEDARGFLAEVVEAVAQLDAATGGGVNTEPPN